MLTGVSDRAGAAHAGGSPHRGRGRRLAWALALAAACAALFALYLRQSLTSPFNSDGAAMVLQGQALLHGNPLLRGWWTADVSFYTTELPEYALVTAVRGLAPDVVHICGALTYTLSVALAALLARGLATGLAGLCRAGLAAGIMLAPSILGGTEVFLENPDHAGTAVPVLVLLLLLDWGERRDGAAFRWCGPAAACALLALTQVADELSLAAATAPVAVVCGVRLLAAAVRRRPRAASAPGETTPGAAGRVPEPRARAGSAGTRRRGASVWPDGLLLAAALVSVGLARLAELEIRVLGGFDKQPLPKGLLGPLSRVPGNARVLWESVVLFFGANSPGAPNTPITIARHVPLALMADLHVIGLVLAGAGLAVGIAVFFSARTDRVTQVLVAAIVAVMAAGVLGTVLHGLSNAHEVAILLPLGAALAGRTLPPLARRTLPSVARRLVPARVRPARVRPAHLAAAVLAGWLALGVAEMCYAATWPEAPSQQQAVAAWLVAHHERDGLAGYWQADATTVASGGRVLVAPVTVTATVAAPRRWEASADWYEPGNHLATFVIAVAGPASAGGGLSPATVQARFGRPAGEYDVGGDIIMTYRYNLLTRLVGRAFPGSGI